MPISKDEFEKYKNPFERITEFLRDNKGNGFSIEELVNGTQIEREIIEPILNLVPLAEVLATLNRRKTPIESVKIDNKIYYRYNEKYS